MFPSNFDLSIYRGHRDLSNLSDEALRDHYRKYGKKEGRVCCTIKDRATLLQYISPTASCLEIGPFDAPVLVGSNVKYADVMNTEDLQIYARSLGRTGTVPFINYVIPTFSLNIREKFDIILSSHSIDHQVCLVRHLQNVSSTLNENGRYIIICPDKRFTFDHFNVETTIAEILDMCNSHSVNHSLKSLIEHRVLFCHNDSLRHWKGDHGSFTINPDAIRSALAEYQNTPGYIDVHSMKFTPESFTAIVQLLKELGLIDLAIEQVYETLYGSNEFYAVLRKAG